MSKVAEDIQKEIEHSLPIFTVTESQFEALTNRVKEFIDDTLEIFYDKGLLVTYENAKPILQHDPIENRKVVQFKFMILASGEPNEEMLCFNMVERVHFNQKAPPSRWDFFRK